MKYLTTSIISCKVTDCITPHSHNCILTVLSVTNFDVLLTMHLDIILVINQLNAQNLVL